MVTFLRINMRTPLEIEAEVCKDYLGGMTYVKMSVKYNISIQTLTEIMKRNSMPKRNAERHVLTQEEIEAICVDYVAGMTYKDLIKKHGVGRSTVERAIDSKGVRRDSNVKKKKPKDQDIRLVEANSQTIGR